MGQSESHSRSPAAEDAAQLLGPQATAKAAALHKERKCGEAAALGALLGGDASLGQRVATAAQLSLGAQTTSQGGLTPDGFVQVCACVSAGTSASKAPFFLACVTGENGAGDADSASKGLQMLLANAYSHMPDSPADKPSAALVQSMVTTMSRDDGKISLSSFRSWMQTSLFATKLLTLALWPLNVGRETSLPQLFVPLQAGERSSLLDPESMMVINAALPKDIQGQWTRMYDSGLHGGSFARFRDSISDVGPCVIVVRDRDGHIFGGFASTSWHVAPKFYGDERCFLFSVRPSLMLYLASGGNDNFQYLNISTETLPNGLGMGGQFNYNGLWLESDLIHGHSKGKPCSTFGSPRLSKEENFVVEHVETWRIGAGTGGTGGTGLGKGNTLFKGRETDEAVLEMAGKTMHGKAFREDHHNA